MALRFVFLAVASQPYAATASQTSLVANPIRKVVNLLQNLQKKVEADGKAADDLFEKFMCYCSSSGDALKASIEEATAKIPELAASIEAAQGKIKQYTSDLKRHKEDRRVAKKAMEEATALREKEKKAFDKAHADISANVKAVQKAVTAISKGMEGGFLQTTAAVTLRNLVTSREGMFDVDRQALLSFLSGGDSGEYAPASGEIVGILKQMLDTMLGDKKEMEETEKGSVNTYEALMAAKQKEVDVNSKQIETKTARIGELGIKLVTMKADAGDFAESIVEDKKFVKDLEKNCKAKKGLHEKEKKMRAEETVALADTIKILNDDDALDLFKKTLPGSSSSFLQVQRTSESVRAEARALLSAARDKSAASGRHRLSFVLLALRGRKVGFEKLVKLIDRLIATLGKEQGDDDDKKGYCEMQIDKSEDQQKELQTSIADLKSELADAKESVATLDEEMTALKTGIVALDKQVEEATAQRKAETAEYKELMKTNTAAKKIILFAKNRLNKFYNPSQYKEPKKEEGEGEEASAFMQLAMHREAPPPPPETAAAYSKKAEESNGVLAMVDLLVQDLDKEMTVAEVEEKSAQAEYEETMEEAGEKRRQDSKSLTDKEGAKADLEGAIEANKLEKKESEKELMGVEKTIANLHGECDWLLKYYKVRKEARVDETDSLKKAKAVLSGADYSLLQRTRAHRLIHKV